MILTNRAGMVKFYALWIWIAAVGLSSTAVQAQYSGGNGDGYDAVASSVSPFPDYVAIYTGGAGDGYDSAGASSASFPDYVDIYDGGTGDGYDSSVSAPSAFPAYVDIYSGGDGDGYSVRSFFTVTLLAVELAAIEVRVDGRHAHVSWQTLSESDNTGFTVEYRNVVMGMDTTMSLGRWSTAGVVESSGDAGARYAFAIPDLPPGAYDIRLKNVSVLGEAEYSSAIRINIDLVDSYDLSGLYPNPAWDLALATLLVRDEQRVTIRLYDASGRLVRTIIDDVVPASRRLRLYINTGVLAGGVYFLRVEGERFRDTKSVVVQHR